MTSIAAAMAGDNVLLTANDTAPAKTIGSLLLRGSGITVSGAAGTNLTINYGALASQGTGNIITTTSLTMVKSPREPVGPAATSTTTAP